MTPMIEPGHRIALRPDAVDRAVAPTMFRDLQANGGVVTGTALEMVGEHVRVAFDVWITDHDGRQFLPWLHESALDDLGC